MFSIMAGRVSTVTVTVRPSKVMSPAVLIRMTTLTGRQIRLVIRERPNITAYQREVLRFCRTRRTITEIAEYMNLGAGFCRDYLLAPLCEQERLRCEVDKAEVKRHCYVTVR